MRIVRHLNAGNLWSLPSWSSVPRASDGVDFARVRDAGYLAVQHHWPEASASSAGLGYAGMLKIVTGTDAAAGFERLASASPTHVTVHLGHGYESPAEALSLIDAVQQQADRFGMSWSVETHRATLTQDPYRTLQLLDARPDLQFTADLSHWYTGTEMSYGDFSWKLEKLRPVFRRTRYVHLRIGHSSVMQLPLVAARELPSWDHYSEMWSVLIEEARAELGPDRELVIAPELLPAAVEFGGQTHHIGYAVLDAAGNEQSDRWAEALELCDHFESLAKRAEAHDD